MFIPFKRAIKQGWILFSRNLGLSIATIFIMLLVTFLITFVFVFNIASKILISEINEKVDISVYFKTDVPAEDILEIKSDLTQIPGVKDVEYVSKEQALEKFIEKHKDNPILMESLTEVGENPFLASLNIRAWQASQYEQISRILENDNFKNLVEKVDYYQRRPIIDKIFSVTSRINKGGIIFGLVLALVSVLIAINTIRIAIFNSSEEIATMRLVGASNGFIRGPFLVQGIIAGILATLIALLMTFGISYGLDAKLKTLAPNISTLGLFAENFWKLFLIQLAIGVGLGVISSMIAVRRYLKV